MYARHGGFSSAETDCRFNNYTLVYGYNQVLQWFCNQTDYFRASDKTHWTIIGEFTRKSFPCGRFQRI
jgi:hypothetical protein